MNPRDFLNIYPQVLSGREYWAEASCSHRRRTRATSTRVQRRQVDALSRDGRSAASVAPTPVQYIVWFFRELSQLAMATAAWMTVTVCTKPHGTVLSQCRPPGATAAY
jgi:hypothetical protein